jgi:hypothetical protein
MMIVNWREPETKATVDVSWGDGEGPLSENYAGATTRAVSAFLTYEWKGDGWIFRTGKFFAGRLNKDGTTSKATAEYSLSTYPSSPEWTRELIAELVPASTVAVLS